MRIATFNVNSIRARKERVLRWLERHRVEVVCLQELKLEDHSFPLEEIQALGYHCAIHGQKTYNGVAILSRKPIDNVQIGMGDDVEDPQSRLIAGDTYGVRVISAYFPNGGAMGSDKYEYKLAWIARLRDRLREELKRGGELILAGDYNIAPFKDDVARPHEWEGGVLANEEVRAALKEIEALGLHDLFRPFHPRGGIYSWWDYRGGGFERGNGLRIDLIYGTAGLLADTVGAIVDREERSGESPSDHAPVIVEIDRR